MLDELCICPCKCVLFQITGITNLTFLLALYPLAAAPAHSAPMGLAVAAEGAGSCQQMLTGIAAWSRVPALSPHFAAGTRGPVGCFLLIPEGHLHRFLPRLKDLPRDTRRPFLLLKQETWGSVLEPGRDVL